MGLYCPQCGTLNREGARFCLSCGKPLANRMVVYQGPMRPGVTILGRYEIRDVLSQGGMALTYDAFDKQMAMSVVIEGIGRQDDPQALNSSRIATLFRKLTHQGIQSLIDVFSHDEMLYVVVEKVDGIALDTLLRKDGRLPEVQVRNLAIQLCDILSYLHAQQIIFRDLKPGNIMIDRIGHVKLVDFSIARLFRPGQTRDTQALGTVGYAAPEQYGGSQTDERSDIYTLGVTLYELLTGYDPASTPMQLPPLREVNASITPAMEWVVTRAIEPRRERRWQSALEMKAALLSASSGQQVLPPPVFQPPIVYTQPILPEKATGQIGPVGSKPSTQLILPTSQRPMRDTSVLPAATDANAVARITDMPDDDHFRLGNTYHLEAGVLAEVSVQMRFKIAKIRLPIRKEVSIDIVVHAEDMAVKPHWILPAVFRQKTESELAQFELVPHKTGLKKIQVEFVYERHWLGQVEFNVEVIA